MKTATLGGIWPAFLTPFAEDGTLAFAAAEALTDLFARQGMGGLYVGGSTGQWVSLTPEERMALVDCVVKASAGRIPVMVHVGATTTGDAVRLARHAAEVGAAAVSAVAPIYYQHPADVIFEHYRRIGEATDLPLYVYHLSIGNQISLGPKEYTRRLLELPNIAGMKITDRDLYVFGLIHAYAGDRLRLFSGADEVMAHAVLSGAIGAIGTFYNLWGPACAAPARRSPPGTSGRVGPSCSGSRPRSTPSSRPGASGPSSARGCSANTASTSACRAPRWARPIGPGTTRRSRGWSTRWIRPWTTTEPGAHPRMLGRPGSSAPEWGVRQSKAPIGRPR